MDCSSLCVFVSFLVINTDLNTLKAGLFSAVLTAFVIESYKRLSPDTSSQMYLVMQQMSSQLSSFNTPIGMINSTYQPLLPIPLTGEQVFQPSSTDIRVNVLWFASLVFSLMTASFGILIKQWLRKYLAVTNPSPQARLRIRHSRHPELQRWRVLEIAAVLPLLQQLSLALFFIGLCYFTESVHSSIGRTTLPLVAGWAFCFATVTILPLFFPRCPYKTALIKNLLISTHFWLARSVKKILVWLYHNTTENLSTASLSLLIRLNEHIKKCNEQTILADEAADLAILAEVDAVQSNDELLGMAIFDSLQQIHNPDYRDGVRFVLRVLGHRLSHKDLASSDYGLVDLRGLSRSGYNAIINILTYFIKMENLGSLLNDQSGVHALLILFSPSRFPLPQSGARFLETVMQDDRARHKLSEKLVQSCVTNCKANEQSSNYMRLLDSIPQKLNLLDIELDISLEFFENILDAWFRREPDCTLPKFTITGDVRFWFWNTVGTWQVMDSLSKIVAHALDRPNAELYTSTGTSSKGALSNALTGMYNLVAVIDTSLSNVSALQDVVVGCLARKAHTSALLLALRQIETSSFLDIADKHDQLLFFLEHYSVPPEGIGNLIDGLAELSSTSQTSFVDPGYALRLLCFATNLVTPSTARQYTDQWRRLFDILMDLIHRSLSSPEHPICTTPAHFGQELGIDDVASRIAKLTLCASSSTAERSGIASQCLTRIQGFDSGGYRGTNWDDVTEKIQSKWLSTFTAEGYAFSDELVEMLAAMYFASSDVDADDSEWWRVKKLRVKERVRAALVDHANNNVSPSEEGSPVVIPGQNSHDNLEMLHQQREHALPVQLVCLPS
jgi:hypothetical protein